MDGKSSCKTDKNIEYKVRTRELFWNRKWVWIALFFVLAVILSCLKPIELADGGAVTYFSLLFIWLITFFYGPKTGIPVSFLFGIPKFFVTYLTGEALQADLQLIADHMAGRTGALSADVIARGVMTFIIEYPLACGMFGIAGLIVAGKAFDDSHEKELNTFKYYQGVPKGHIRSENKRLKLGYLIGAAGMAVCYFAADVLFYGQEKAGFWANIGYKFTYNISFILIEAVITIIILLIPAVSDAVFFLKHVATTQHEDPTLKYF